MTQPSRRIGPPSVGSQAVQGGSQPGAGAVFRGIQRNARGCAEWIDAGRTGTGTAMAQGHDHRGATWGRPLGSALTIQFYRVVSAGLYVYGFGSIMVPDCSPLGGQEMRDPDQNGGFQSPKLWIYADSAIPAGINLQLSMRIAGSGEASVRGRYFFAHPGGGKAWVQSSDLLVLPSGLIVVVAIADPGVGVASVEQLTMAVPH